MVGKAKSMKKKNITKTLLNEITEFSRSHLPPTSDNQTFAASNILDAHIGAVDLFPHEIDLLNTPLLQRLRQIHQMAFAFFAYPTARHSRYEHSIGAVRQSATIAVKIRVGQPGMIDETAIREIRLAALLHDCGHGCFSHSSETYYSNFPEIEAMRSERNEMKYAAPHEILSCLILESEPFSQFMRDLQRKYRIDIDQREIINCILGVSGAMRRFKSEVINGPFDADKLDYVLRDYASLGLGGPSLTEIDHLMSGIDITWFEDQPRMTISSERLSIIEHLLFSKMLMFSAVYSQSALRACECMLHGIFEYCRKTKVTVDGRSFDTILDFLWTTDYQLLTAGKRTQDKELARLLNRLSMRDFLTPSVILSIYSVKEREPLDIFIKSLSSFDLRRQLSEKIWEAAGKPCLLEEVWVDVPGLPSLRSFETILVTMGTGNVAHLYDIIPISQWANIYLKHKWRAFVFCPLEHRDRISKAAKHIIKELYGIEFNNIAFSIK